MIDIHSHVLPGVDDGAKDLDTSICMLRNAVQCNTNSIIATPHYYRNHFELEYEKVINEVEKLKKEVKSLDLDIELYSGQEVFVDNYTVELFKNGIVKGLCGTDYMLVEFSMEKYSNNYLDILYELRLLGVRPIVAHPERYLYIMENIELVNDFIDEGCLFQINSGSITGIFGRKVEKAARRLIEGGTCHFIASDAHSVNKRCTGLNQALDMLNKINSSAAADVQLNAQLLLMNKKITNDGCKISKKKRFFW